MQLVVQLAAAADRGSLRSLASGERQESLARPVGHEGQSQPEGLLPTLALVSGPPGSGKTTLAHRLARLIPCPVVSRDEIKEGLVHAAGGDKPVWGGPISARTHQTFYATIESLLRAGVTVVAEAALERGRAEAELAPLLGLGRSRLIHCSAPPDLARERFVRRAATDPPRTRISHPDEELVKALDDGSLTFDRFGPLDLSVPLLTVDTTDGYDPPLEAILAFVEGE